MIAVFPGALGVPARPTAPGSFRYKQKEINTMM